MSVSAGPPEYGIQEQYLRFLREWTGAVEHPAIEFIYGGGSDREFFRVILPSGSFVLMHSRNAEEFDYQIRIGTYLREKGIHVPEIIGYSYAEGLALFEDAGREPLQERVLRYLSCEEDNRILDLYRAVLGELIALQRIDPSGCPALTARTFGYADLRWETQYFRENLLGRMLGLMPDEDPHLTEEFSRLAGQLQEIPPVTMHRDFQSQNIFLVDESLRILDFQGARLGPPHYDLAALLRDPYVSLPRHIQEDLFKFYLDASGIRPGMREEFRKNYVLLSLQRLMQALGAYAYLSLVKGKRGFAGFVIPGLRQFCAALEETRDFPNLSYVAAKAKECAYKHPALQLDLKEGDQ